MSTRLKEVVAPWVVDWVSLEKQCLHRDLKVTLTQLYKPPDGGTPDFYQDLQELVDKHAQLPIYQGLCCEFHDTYILKENPESMDDKDFMTFKLGGVNRHMSLMDFTRCLKIYSPEQMSEQQQITDYIWSGSRISDISKWEKDFSYTDKVWKHFSRSGSTWSPGQVSCSDVDIVCLRLFHLVLTRNITHRTVDNDMVSLSDLWFLENIRSDTHVNVPYCVAYYLKHWAIGVRPDSPICGGHYVTLIARHLGVKCDAFHDDGDILDSSRSCIGDSEYAKANLLSKSVEEEEESETDSDTPPYTTEYTTLEIVTWLKNLTLVYKETLSDKKKFEKLHEEGNLSEDIQLLLEQVDEIEKVNKLYLDQNEPKTVPVLEPQTEQPSLWPNKIIHDIVIWMKELKLEFVYNLSDENEMLRLQQEGNLTEYTSQIFDQLAEIKDISRIKLAEIEGKSSCSSDAASRCSSEDARAAVYETAIATRETMRVIKEEAEKRTKMLEEEVETRMMLESLKFLSQPVSSDIPPDQYELLMRARSNITKKYKNKFTEDE